MKKKFKSEASESDYAVGPLTMKEIQTAISKRVSKIDREFRSIFQFIKDYPRSVSIFGSSRTEPGSPSYEHARRLGHRIATELGYTVLTGGGGGIMEAGNRGAFEAGGESVGLNIKLPKEQQPNSYTTSAFEAFYFFTRKVGLSFAAEAYIFFPGGYGTMDEFFEILTLVQTKKIRHVPIILVGSHYWEPLENFFQNYMLREYKAISPADLGLYTITDNDDTVIDLIRGVPVSVGVRGKQHSK